MSFELFVTGVVQITQRGARYAGRASAVVSAIAAWSGAQTAVTAVIRTTLSHPFDQLVLKYEGSPAMAIAADRRSWIRSVCQVPVPALARRGDVREPNET